MSLEEKPINTDGGPTPQFAQIGFQVAQDGSSVSISISLFGVSIHTIAIPRQAMLMLMQEWVNNEKKLQDIRRVLQNGIRQHGQ